MNRGASKPRSPYWTTQMITHRIELKQQIELATVSLYDVI